MGISQIKLLITMIGLSLSFSVFSKEASSSDAESDARYVVTELGNGLYMLSGEGGFVGGNVALSIGEDGVIMIDDSADFSLKRLQDAVATITDQPIDFLFNTHTHSDHVGNNETYGEKGAYIVGHKNARRYWLKQLAKNNVNPFKSKVLPVITFSENIDFYLNGNSVHLLHLPNAHTDSDIIIHFVEANVIHMGDAFYKDSFPYIDYSKGGNFDDHIIAQQTVLSFINDKTKIIPGHGSLATKQDLQDSLDMLIEARSIIDKLVKVGKTEEEIIALNPLKHMTKRWGSDLFNTEGMIKRVYQGLTTDIDPAPHSHEKH